MVLAWLLSWRPGADAPLACATCNIMTFSAFQKHHWRSNTAPERETVRGLMPISAGTSGISAHSPGLHFCTASMHYHAHESTKAVLHAKEPWPTEEGPQRSHLHTS